MNAVKILCFVFVLLAICTIGARTEDESAAAPRRPNLLLKRPGARVLGKTTTTTTTPQPEINEEDYVDENNQNEQASAAGEGEINYDEDQPIEEPSSSTTEAPKKSQLKLGVRPFRSNDDLLQALKRRQQNSKSAKKAVSYKPIITEPEDEAEEQQEQHVPVATQAPVPSERNARKRFGGNRPNLRKVEPQPEVESDDTVEEEDAAAPSLPATLARRPARNRFTLNKN